eukprot:306748-Chlamydomonas_euryale.AAC.1
MRIACRGRFLIAHEQVAEDGHVEQLNSAIRGCHGEGSGGGTIFRVFQKLPGHTKLISWPEIRAAVDYRLTYDTVLRSPWRK